MAKLLVPQDNANDLKAEVLHALGLLREDITSQSQASAQLADQEKLIALHQERLSARELEVSRLSSDLAESRTKEATLREILSGLQASNDALQAKNAVASSETARLSQVTLDNSMLREEAEKAITEAATANSKLTSVIASNQALQDDLTDLQRRFDEMTAIPPPDFAAERAELERKAEVDKAAAQAEISRQCKKINEDQEAQYLNNMRQANRQKEKLSKERDEARNELQLLLPRTQILQDEADAKTQEIQQLKAAINEAKAKSQHLEEHASQTDIWVGKASLAEQ